MSILLAIAAGAIVGAAIVIVTRYALTVERDLRALDLTPGHVIFRGPARARR
jgi:hypothetical protein